MSCNCYPQPGLGFDAPKWIDSPETIPGRASLSRRFLLAGGLAVGAAPFVPRLARPAAAANLYNSPDVTSSIVRSVMFPIVPVAGSKVNRLRNYGDNRGSHIHAGEDMMADKLSLLLACVDGTIVRKVHSSSGNYLYIQDGDGWIYGYLHVNNDTPGTDDGKNPEAWAFGPAIEEGAKVRQGQLIAYVGDSGNAEGSGSHVHFEIRKPNTKWYWAQAVDPEPSLDAATTAIELGPTSNPAILIETTTTTTTPPLVVAPPFAPFATPAAFADRQARDFLGRAPAAAWTASAVRQLNAGTTADTFVAGLVGDPAITRTVNPVIRLYQAYFGGVPPYEGVAYWVKTVRGGTSLDRASQMLSTSGKFVSQWGPLSDSAFARRIYLNLYGVAPSQKVLSEMTTMLGYGLARGALVRAICESTQFRTRSAKNTQVTSVYHAMLKRAPATLWRDRWAARAEAADAGLADLIGSIRTGGEYAKRFG